MIHTLYLLRLVTVSFYMSFPGVPTTFIFLFLYEMFSYKFISENLSITLSFFFELKKKLKANINSLYKGNFEDRVSCNCKSLY